MSSTLGFWYIQRYWKISTKKMVSISSKAVMRILMTAACYVLLQFVVTNVVTIFIPLWGMIGIWTNKFGYVAVIRESALF